MRNPFLVPQASWTPNPPRQRVRARRVVERWWNHIACVRLCRTGAGTLNFNSLSFLILSLPATVLAFYAMRLAGVGTERRIAPFLFRVRHLGFIGLCRHHPLELLAAFLFAKWPNRPTPRC